MDEVYGSARLLFNNTNDGQQSELGDVMGNFFGGTYLDNEATEIEENLLFSQNGGGGSGGGGGGPTTKYHRKGTEKREKRIQIP
jgi:hypothetical protein